MGRTDAKLLPFIENGLYTNKYENLKLFGDSGRVFTLDLPHKTGLVQNANSQLILKDWYKLTNRSYIWNLNYSKAKQNMISNLRSSDFIKRIRGPEKKWIYCLLNDEEIKEKKREKKEREKKKKLSRKDSVESSDCSPSSVQSSGYGSSIDSPQQPNINDHDVASTHAIKHDESDHALLHANQHDHESLIKADAPDGNHLKKMQIDTENINAANVQASPPNQIVHNSMSKRGIENSTLAGDLKMPMIHNAAISLINGPSDISASSNSYLAVNDFSFNSYSSENSPSLNICQQDIVDGSNSCPANIDVNLNSNSLDIAASFNIYPEDNNFGFNASQPHNTLCMNNVQLPNNATSASKTLNLQDSEASFKDCDLSETISDDLNEFPDAEDFVVLSPEDLEGLSNEFPDWENILTSDEISEEIDSPPDELVHSSLIGAGETSVNGVPSTISDKVQKGKIYVPCHFDITPGIVVLTCQPKYMEFDASINSVNDPNIFKLVFDEATQQMASKCILLETKLLENDHLLLILKYKEPIIQSSPNTAFLNN